MHRPSRPYSQAETGGVPWLNTRGGPMMLCLCSVARREISLVLIAVVVGGGMPDEPKRFDARNFEILGVALGTSEDAELTPILGPAAARAKDPEESVRCYVSTGRDHTILEFVDWLGTLVQFRFFSGTSRAISRCASTSRVSDALATGSGLKLGMSRTEVVALLGQPTKVQRDDYVYLSVYDRPLTAQESQLAKSSYHSPPQAVEVYEKIEVKFNASRAALVDVVRSETW